MIISSNRWSWRRALLHGDDSRQPAVERARRCRLRLRQRSTRAALRAADRLSGFRDAQGRRCPKDSPLRRTAHAGGHSESHRQRHVDFARRARRVDHGATHRRAAAAAARERSRRRARHSRREDHPRICWRCTRNRNRAPAATRGSIPSAWHWRTSTSSAAGARVIAASEQGERVTGIDRAGHDFAYTLAEPVDASGKLLDGRRFQDIRELKAILAANPRQLARNLLHQFTLYATGTPVRFSDRREIEAMLDACAADGYRVAICACLVQSRCFLDAMK